MNDLKEPAFVTYRLEGTSEGVRADLMTEPCGHVRFTFGNNEARWTLRHSAREAKTEIVDAADGLRIVSTNVGPTWATTYRELRNPPLRFGPAQCSSLPAPPTPAPSADLSGLKTIGTVAALGPGIYNVADRGEVACPDGSPGRALHLWSRTNNPRQTLSDVVIDLRSMRFCAVRFGVRGSAGIGGTAVYELHFADVGGYWVQTGGTLDVTARVVGIAAGHGVWRFRLLDMQFPDSLPPEAIAP